LILVVVVFALLWLPIHLVLLFVSLYPPPEYPDLYTDLFNAVYVLCTGLAYFNACVNPIIYNRTSKDFRDAFRSAVGCQKREKVDWGDAATPLQAGHAAATRRGRDDEPRFAVDDGECADGKIHVEN